MSEHKDDALSSVKESTATADSATGDGIVTERGKIEEIFGERESEDMVVDVVSADVVVERETGAQDHVMEDVDVVKGGDDDVVESRVKILEKVEVVVSEEGVKGSVEVVKEVVQENVVTTVVSGSGCDDQKSGNGPAIGDFEMAKAGGGEVEVREPVQEVADGGHVPEEKTQKETDVLNSSKLPASTEGHVVIEEGLVGKDKAEDGVNNQNALNEVVSAGTCEDDVHVSPKNMEYQAGVEQTKKESFESKTEATENDSQESGNGTQVGDSKKVVELELDRGAAEETVERSTESAQEATDVDCVMSEKTGKDEILDSTKIPDSVTKVDEVITMEGLAGKDETQDVGSKKVVELDRGAAEETVERTTESAQEATDVDCVMSEKTGKDEILDSTKIPDSVTKVDEVITMEGLAGKDETQDVGSEDQSKIVNTGTCGGAAVHENAEILDQNAEVDPKNKDESLQSTIEVRTHDASKSGKETKVGDCKADDEPEIIKGDIDVVDKGDGDQDSSKIPQSSIMASLGLEVGDCKADDEPEIIKGEIDVVDKGDGDQDSSKILQSSIMASLGLEEVDVVVVDEGLEEKNEEQDRVSVEASLVNPDDQSMSTEVVNDGTGEVDQKAEVHSTRKDESSFAPIKPEEVAACSKVDEVTVAQKEPNSDVQVSTDGGILVENQSINVNAVSDSSKPDVVAYTEPVSSIDKMTPSIANAVVETDTGVQTLKVETAAICCDSSDFQVDQGLNANHTNEGNEITSHIRVPDSTVEVPTTGRPQTHTEHGVLPENSEFSYEDAHMERAEDAGMDIDEVLGWKDELSSVQEDEQKVDSTNLSNVEMQETKAVEHTLDPEQWNKTPVSLQQPCYFHPPEKEGEFSVSDLVWGKVRSHPWWPGQIFDPSDASEKAMKYHKKDCFLVAYFGDRTFAWNDSAVLKPFRENFSQVLDHMYSEGFNNAVHCALQEVSRRVELGLTCSCIPQEIYENIKCQIVENSGIKQESSRRHGVDKSASVNSFVPDMLVDYVRLLAKFPYGEGDKMELTIAKAQLSSYSRFKGHRQLAEFQLCGDLLEAEQAIKDETYSEDGSKKRKALDSISDGSEKRPTLQTETVTAMPSFEVEVGGGIQEVASQLTGPPEQVTGPGPMQLGNQADMLSQLHLAAQDPMKGYGFMNNIIPFFNSHRATVLSKSSLNSTIDARKRKTSNENQPEDFEFDDVNDSYWTDRIIQNNPEENPLQENQNGGGAHHIVAYEQEKQPVKPARRSNKKRFFSSNHEIEAKEQSELIERRRKNLATEVLMKFTEGIYFPSEIHLNKMFRRFGPLMESETEVDRQSGRARVVFKKCSDAEVAHSSAGKFNIFGSINVHYELNYTPLISYKPLPLPLAQDPAHAC